MDTPTKVLFERTKDMSVHQTISYHTLLNVFKILRNKKPTYLSERLDQSNNRQSRNAQNITTKGDLTVTRGGFMYRGSKIFNMLPEEIKLAATYGAFKSKVKKWIKSNISVKP